MMTRLFRLVAPAIVVSAVACASSGPTIDGRTDFGSLNGAKVEITSEGGIAALSISQRLDHDSRTFSYRQGRLCGTTCPAPIDTASGTLSPTLADSVFAVVLDQARALSKDDYGATQSGADMMTYTIRVTADGRMKTIRGDDGTLPDPAHRILSTVREAIATARGR